MRTQITIAAFVCLMSGCEQWVPLFDLGATGGDLGCPSSPDLATPAAKCAAAKGLSGDNLLCVDFKDVQNLTSLTGWNFSCLGPFTWTSTGGALQVNNFGTFNDDCTARLPSINLNDADKRAYKSLTLSLVHRIDLNDPEQKAQIFLNDTSDQTRLMYFATGKKNPSRQRTIVELDQADLPAMLNNAPQWILKLNSSVMVSRQGWQIESIAIQGVR